MKNVRLEATQERIIIKNLTIKLSSLDKSQKIELFTALLEEDLLKPKDILECMEVSCEFQMYLEVNTDWLDCRSKFIKSLFMRMHPDNFPGGIHGKEWLEMKALVTKFMDDHDIDKPDGKFAEKT